MYNIFILLELHGNSRIKSKHQHTSTIYKRHWCYILKTCSGCSETTKVCICLNWYISIPSSHTLISCEYPGNHRNIKNIPADWKPRERFHTFHLNTLQIHCDLHTKVLFQVTSKSVKWRYHWTLTSHPTPPQPCRSIDHVQTCKQHHSGIASSMCSTATNVQQRMLSSHPTPPQPCRRKPDARKKNAFYPYGFQAVGKNMQCVGKKRSHTVCVQHTYLPHGSAKCWTLVPMILDWKTWFFTKMCLEIG